MVRANYSALSGSSHCLTLSRSSELETGLEKFILMTLIYRDPCTSADWFLLARQNSIARVKSISIY